MDPHTRMIDKLNDYVTKDPRGCLLKALIVLPLLLLLRFYCSGGLFTCRSTQGVKVRVSGRSVAARTGCCIRATLNWILGRRWMFGWIKNNSTSLSKICIELRKCAEASFDLI